MRIRILMGLVGALTKRSHNTQPPQTHTWSNGSFHAVHLILSLCLALFCLAFIGCQPTPQSSTDQEASAPPPTRAPSFVIDTFQNRPQTFPPERTAEVQETPSLEHVSSVGRDLVEPAHNPTSAKAPQKTPKAISTVRVQHATGTWERSQEGDLKRFQALHHERGVLPHTITQNTPIFIRFTGPVVPQSSLGYPMLDTPEWFDVEPPRAGRSMWKERDLFVFEPTEPWEMGSVVKFSVDRTEAIQNEAGMVQPFAWNVRVEGAMEPSFRTLGNKLLMNPVEDGKPRLIGRWPGGNRQISPGKFLSLVFDQPVEPSAIQPHVGLWPRALRDPQGEHFTLRHPKKDPTWYNHTWPKSHVLEVVPRVAFEPGESFQVVYSSAITREDTRQWYSFEYVQPFQTRSCEVYKARHPRTVYTNATSCEGQTVEVEADETVYVSWEFASDPSQKSLDRVLRVEPAVKHQRSWSHYNTYEAALTLEPNTSYTVTLSSKARDVHGQALQNPQTLRITTKPLSPILEAKADTQVFEMGQPVKVAFSLRNVESVRVYGVPLSASHVAKAFAHAQPGEDVSQVFSSVEWGHATERVVPTQQPITNEKRDVFVDLGPFLPKQEGYSLLRIEDEHKRVGPVLVLVHLTDVGLSVQQLPEGTHVWATRLSDGAPLSGASVTVWGKDFKRLASEQTDARGLAFFSAEGDTPYTIQATHERSHALVAVRDGKTLGYRAPQYPSTAVFHGGGAKGEELQVWGISERGVYRPGERVHTLAYAARSGPHPAFLKEGTEVLVRLKNPKDEVVERVEVSINAYGGATHTFALSDRAPLGSWRVEWVVGEEVLDSQWFRVEEYRPVRFKASSRLRCQDEQLQARVSGSYLFGAPLSGGVVSWSLDRWRANPRVDRAVRSFSFKHTDPTGTYSSEYTSKTSRGRSVLDVEGRWSGTLHPKGSSSAPDLHGPWTVELRSTVQGPDHQEASASAYCTLHDRDTYLGVEVEDEDTLIQSGDVLKARAVAVSSDGELRAGVRVAMSLIRVERRTALERGAGGSYRRVQERVEIPDGSCFVRTKASGPVSCRLKPSKSGYYRLVATGYDRARRPLKSSDVLYVEGKGYTPWYDDDPEPNTPPEESIELDIDTRKADETQTVRALIKTPWAQGWAWVMLYERGRVVWQHMVQLRGSLQSVSVPIDRMKSSVASLHVSAVRGRIGNTLDAFGYDRMAPNALSVSETFRLSISKHRLDVEIKPSSRVASPGSALPVDLSVRDNDGNPVHASITLWAVDEAVLNLTGFALHDPTYHLFHFDHHSNNPAHRSDSHRALLARRLHDLGLDLPPGDGSDTHDPPPIDRNTQRLRSTFQTTPIFLAQIPTAQDGAVRTVLSLPDNTTRFRLFAVASDSSHRIGKGETSVRTSKKVLINANLPRFLNQGDRFDAQATIHNNTSEERTVDLNVYAQGIEILGDPEQRITIPRRSSRTVSFPAKVAWLGDVSMTWAARDLEGSIVDQIQTQLPAQYPSPALHASTSGTMHGSLDLRLKYPRDAVLDRGHTHLHISTRLLTMFGGAVQNLLRYPYGCVEQTSSSTLPLIFFKEHLKTLGIRMSDEEVQKRIHVGIKRLFSMQTPSGGLGYWPGSSDPHVFGSVYGLFTLNEAARLGVDVPQHPLRLLALYVASLLNRSTSSSSPLDPTTRAFAQYTLARVGSRVGSLGHKTIRSDALTLEELHNQPTEALAFRTLALLHTSAPKSHIDPHIQTLQARFVLSPNGVQYTPGSSNTYRSPHTFSSPDRIFALALLAFGQHDTTAPHTEALARHVWESGRHGSWSSTQSNLWSLYAISALDAAQYALSAPLDLEITLNGQPLQGVQTTAQTDNSLSVDLPTDDLIASPDKLLQIQTKNEKRTLYYTLETRTIPGPSSFRAKPTRSPQGPTLHRALFSLSGDPVTEPVHAGDTVLVQMTVQVSKTAHYMVLDVPIPAGLEPLNLSLSSVALPKSRLPHRPHFVRSGRRVTSHSELRDDRALFFADVLPKGTYTFHFFARATASGVFAWPSAHLQDMYDASFWAMTEMNSLEILPRVEP